MSRRASLEIDLSAIGPDTPLRLELAAQLAYPDGSMTKSGLRREIARGHLECERTAGKQYVTLADIQRMRARCRENQKVPASIFVNEVVARPSTSSSMEKTRSALAAAEMVAQTLKRPLPTTSAENTSRTGSVVTLGEIAVADVLAFYGAEKAPTLVHPELVGYHLTPPLKHFGTSTCWQVDGDSCRSYAKRRMAGELGRAVKSATARRELVTLTAALNFAYTERKLSQPVPVTLPAGGEPRTKWLSRSDAAALIAGALGITATLSDIKTRKPMKWGRLFQPSYHVARFVLIGLYTGTRHEANLNMRWGLNSKGGWFDLDRGSHVPARCR